MRRLLAFRIGCVAVCLLAGCTGDSSQPGRPPPELPSTSGRLAPELTKVVAVWPTPHDVFLRGGGLEDFVQPAVSGRLESGLYGSTRNGGRRFHEGLDIRPVARDAQGEAKDEVRAALAGVVRHVSDKPGASSYGRYVVIEHTRELPAVYTLYAHLAQVKKGLVPGTQLEAGQVLGVMGRSAGGYTIPKDRAHLHFEIGLRVTDRFGAWYAGQRFGNPNEHGLWNGMNLLGLDPLVFFERVRAGGLHTIADWMATLPIAVTVRVERAFEPDFIQRYPALLNPGPGDADYNAGRPYAWQIGFDPTGVPLRWKRVPAALVVTGPKRKDPVVIAVDEALVASQPAKALIKKTRAGEYMVGDTLLTTLAQVFE